MSLLLALTSGGGPTNYADSLSAGAYVIAGQSLNDVLARNDSLSPGAYVITGNDLTDATGGGTDYADDLSAGQYIIVGSDLTESVPTQEIIFWPGGWVWPSTRNKKFYEEQISEELKEEILSIEPQAAEVIIEAAEEEPDAGISAQEQMRLEMERLGIVYRQAYKEIYLQLLEEKKQQEEAEIAIILAMLI